MTVDILSSIKGEPSEAVDELFDVIKNAQPTTNNSFNNVSYNAVSLIDLREVVVIKSSAIEREIIK